MNNKVDLLLFQLAKPVAVRSTHHSIIKCKDADVATMVDVVFAHLK